MPSPSLVVSCTLARWVPLRCGRHQPEGRGGHHRGSAVTSPGLRPFRLQSACRGCMTGHRNQRTSLSEAEESGRSPALRGGPFRGTSRVACCPRGPRAHSPRHLLPLDGSTKAVSVDTESAAELVSKAVTHTTGSSPIPRPKPPGPPYRAMFARALPTSCRQGSSFPTVHQISPSPPNCQPPAYRLCGAGGMPIG